MVVLAGIFGVNVGSQNQVFMLNQLTPSSWTWCLDSQRMGKDSEGWRRADQLTTSNFVGWIAPHLKC